MLKNVMDQVSVVSHQSFEDEIDEDELEGPDCKAVFKENLTKVGQFALHGIASSMARHISLFLSQSSVRI